MFLHQSATKLVHFSRKSVQKITIMADYYHRSVKIADGLLQHIFGTHVKMIRGSSRIRKFTGSNSSLSWQAGYALHR